MEKNNEPFLLFCLFIFPVYSYTATDPKLDAACETARETKLTPERVALIKQCIAEGKTRSH